MLTPLRIYVTFCPVFLVASLFNLATGWPLEVTTFQFGLALALGIALVLEVAR